MNSKTDEKSKWMRRAKWIKEQQVEKVVGTSQTKIIQNVIGYLFMTTFHPYLSSKFSTQIKYHKALLPFSFRDHNILPVADIPVTHQTVRKVNHKRDCLLHLKSSPVYSTERICEYLADYREPTSKRDGDLCRTFALRHWDIKYPTNPWIGGQ